MKNAVCAILVGLISTSAAAEGSPKFIDFAVKQARDRGLNRCDSAVREVFKHAGGSDIRVWTDVVEQNKNDQIQIAGAFGNDGDMATIDANIRRVGDKCFVQVSSTIVANQSCPSYLSDNSAWKAESNTGNIIQVINSGGVTALLRPVGQNCVVTFRRSVTTKAG